MRFSENLRAASENFYNQMTLLLVAAGLMHLGVFLAADQSWEGSVSLRKPALFGISTGVTLFSLLLLWRKLPSRRYDAIAITATALAAVVEVFLITLQYWRGVASHFNHATPMDFTIHLLMDACVVVLFVAITDLTIRSFGTWQASADVKIAYQQGMVLLFVSCLIGFLILGVGFVQKSRGLPPEIYLGQGVLKFPHGIAIHAIQYLTLLSWGLSHIRLSKRSAVMLVGAVAVGFWGQLIYSLLQTFQGRARFELTPFSGLILVASTLLVVGPVVIAVLQHLRRKFRAAA